MLSASLNKTFPSFFVCVQITQVGQMSGQLRDIEPESSSEEEEEVEEEEEEQAAAMPTTKK